jgi:basic membrane lipoprotein Med (substrate-binding protein (PBP1-ABC) superfamily)
VSRTGRVRTRAPRTGLAAKSRPPGRRPPWPRSRRGWLAAGGVVTACLLVAVLLIVLLPGGGTPPAGTGRARQYLAFDACLLTDAHGLAGTEAAQAWAGMQAASLATHAKVEYLPVAGAQTTGAARPYLASLVQRHCNVVIAEGAAQVAAVAADAGQFKSVRFAVIGGHATAPNVTALSAQTTEIKPAVDQVVTSAVRAS